jgi:hypothetical protein
MPAFVSFIRQALSDQSGSLSRPVFIIVNFAKISTLSPQRACLSYGSSPYSKSYRSSG